MPDSTGGPVRSRLRPGFQPAGIETRPVAAASAAVSVTAAMTAIPVRNGIQDVGRRKDGIPGMVGLDCEAAPLSDPSAGLP